MNKDIEASKIKLNLTQELSDLTIRINKTTDQLISLKRHQEHLESNLRLISINPQSYFDKVKAEKDFQARIDLFIKERIDKTQIVIMK